MHISMCVLGRSCTDELNDGRWEEEGVWHPNYCTLYHFQTRSVNIKEGEGELGGGMQESCDENEIVAA